MADHEFYGYSNLFPPPAGTGLWRWNALAACAVLGGVSGATVGSAVGAVPAAADVIATTAAIVALIFVVPGARFGLFFGQVQRVRWARLFVGAMAAIGGAILGALLATMVLLALGAILGSIGGWLVARTVIALRHGILRRLLAGFAGALLGMFLGALLWAIRLNQPAALAGAAWGAGIGIVAGPLLFLAFVGTLRGLPPAPGRETGQVIDATFQADDPPSLPRQE